MEERLEEGLIAALEDWNESRETEGAALARDMTSRIAQMEEWVSRIDERARAGSKEERFAVLRERLSKPSPPSTVNWKKAASFRKWSSSPGQARRQRRTHPPPCPSGTPASLEIGDRRRISAPLTSRFRSASAAKLPPAATKIKTPRRPALVKNELEKCREQVRIWNNHVKRTDHQPRVRQFRGRFPVVGIINPASSPMRRLREDARTEGRLVDATQGRKNPFHHHNRFQSRDPFRHPAGHSGSTFHAGGGQCLIRRQP